MKKGCPSREAEIHFEVAVRVHVHTLGRLLFCCLVGNIFAWFDWHCRIDYG